MDNIDDAYPLTPLQLGMLYHVLREPASDVYVAYISVDIHGAIDESCWIEAWQAVLDRHDSLRTTFLWDGLDEPLQIVHTRVPFSCGLQDCTKVSPADRESQIRHALSEERQRAFDLANAPLMRCRLLRWSDTEHTLIWSIHHLLADDWSTPVILQDILSAYTALSSPPAAHDAQPSRVQSATSEAPAFRFADHVHWLNSLDQGDAMAYWRAELAGCQPTSIPTVSATTQAMTNQPPLARSDADSHTFDTLTCHLDEPCSARLNIWCKQHKLTLSTLAHGIWALLISRYAATDAPLFGSSTAGRLSGLPGIERAVGLFLNTLPVVARVEHGLEFPVWLEQLQVRLQRQLRFEHSPLNQVQATADRAHGEALFESVVVVESHAADLTVEHKGSALAIDNIDYLTFSNYPLTFLVFPGDSLKLRLAFDRTRFSADTATSIQNDLIFLFNRIVKQDSNCPTLEILLRELASRHSDWAVQGRLESQPPSVELDRPTRIHHWFEQTAFQNPGTEALVCQNERLTFSELNRRATDISNDLRTAGLSAGSLVGLCVSRSADQIAAMLAILKADCSYLPLDPGYPGERLTHLLSESAVSLVLTRAGDDGALTRLAGSEPRYVGRHTAQRTQTPSLELIRVANDASGATTQRADPLAYVLFTSGSTGSAKGVEISHGNLIESTAARIEYYAESAPRFLMMSSIAFDSSVAGMFWCLCGGGTLVLPPPGAERNIEALSTLIDQQRIDTTLCLPTSYRLLMTLTPAAHRTSLSRVIVAGETCTIDVLEQWQREPTRPRLFNEYGPTEATVWCSVYEVSNTTGVLPARTIPIGRPPGRTRIALINAQELPAAPGTTGEIVVCGPSVSQGYRNHAELTTEAFSRLGWIDPMHSPISYRTGDRGCWVCDIDGIPQLMFLGRMDRQIKIRGHRIEPAEIEQRLLEHALVERAVVMAIDPDDVSNDDLVDWLESLDDADIDTLLTDLSPSTDTTQHTGSHQS